MLDRLIKEASARFELRDRGVPLVEHLLEMITDREHGRIGGFLAAFREEGMDAQVDSWVAEGPGEELSGPEVETGLGPGLVEEMAQRFGLDAARLAAALGFLIPRILDALTPGGDVPDEDLLLARVEALRAGIGPAAPAAPAATQRQAEAPSDLPVTASREAPATVPPEAPLAAAPREANDERSRRPGALAWLLPLIVLLALVWWAARQCAPESRTDGDPARPAAAPPETGGDTPRAATTPSEAAGLRAGRGRRAENGSDLGARRPARRPAASAIDGRAQPESERELQPSTEAAPDHDVVAETEVEATSAAPSADAADLDTPTAGDGVEALAALDPDFTPDELVAALNRGRIDFAPSSAAISSQARATLEEAANAILALPAGTRLEIAGHTDAAGEPRRNQRLSQARAEAVRNILVEFGVPSAMLVPRGYGASRPVASNDTADGRLQNRRIEFSVVEE